MYLTHGKDKIYWRNNMDLLWNLIATTLNQWKENGTFAKIRKYLKIRYLLGFIIVAGVIFVVIYSLKILIYVIGKMFF